MEWCHIEREDEGIKISTKQSLCGLTETERQSWDTRGTALCPPCIYCGC